MARPARYYTGNGTTPRAELFDAEAQEEARLWVGIAPSQLRRFFGQVMADRRRLELKGSAADDDEARVAMALLKASAAYTAAREPKRKPLADFVAHHQDKVAGVRDFNTFARHFEAVVAWHKVFEKQRKDAEPQQRQGDLSGGGGQWRQRGRT